MRIKPSEKWWKPPEVQVENKKSKWFVKRSDGITVVVALIAVVIGILTVYVAPYLWPARLALSILAFSFAYLSTSRVNFISFHAVDTDWATATVSRECPNCGESLNTHDSSCSECGWK
jgi:ribosomal protein S27AE